MDSFGRIISRLRCLCQLSIRLVIVAVVLVGMLVGSGVPGAWAVPKPAAAATEPPGPSADALPPVEDAPVPNGGSADAGDIPSETVSRFVEAYLAVVALIESKEASLQRAETDTESQQMQEEIQREAIELIQAHELTLQSYWELLGLANSDPEFRERVLAQVEEASL